MNKPPQFGRFGAPVGVVLAAVGLLAVAVGWNGAASQTSVTAQLPYLLSGGMIGLGLVVIGAAVMVVTGAREDRARLEAKLDQLVDAMSSADLGSGSGARRGGAAPQDLAGLVVAGTASYHVPGCRLVDGREETGYLSPAEARSRMLKACRVCQPDAAVPDVLVR
ncbi:MAG: hypothetical protein JWO60_2982 [Frankiales bacterium]|nr:hypothetical protein [Frankiales bacterium]